MEETKDLIEIIVLALLTLLLKIVKKIIMTELEANEVIEVDLKTRVDNLSKQLEEAQRKSKQSKSWIDKILENALKRLFDALIGRLERWINADLDGDGKIG